MKRICLVYNFAQHYRTNIFTLMDQELPIDFVFGDKYYDVKKMDYSLLKNFKKEVHNKIFIIKPFTYQTEVLSLLKNEYETYIILGDIHNVSTWLILFFAKLYKKKVYLWTHGWYGKENKLARIVKLLYFSLAKGIFLYGNYAKELMIKNGINDSKLYVIYNSLHYDKHLQIRKDIIETNIFRDRFKNENKNIIFIGRLTSQKKLDILLNTIHILKKTNKIYNLTIVGDGEKKQDLKKLAKELKIEDAIWFFGSCYDEKKISELIYNADLCVSPGNVGLTAIHSMTFGTPVITHNNKKLQMPEFESIKIGITGELYEYNNVESLKNSIIKWFANNQNRDAIRSACYQEIDSKWNPHFQIKVFREVLKNI